MAKRPLGCDVLLAAKNRISKVFDDFPRIYLSFSGGKDSAVMMHLVMHEAQLRNRKIGVLFVDLEAQYKLTIDHVTEMFELYKEWIDPYWVALPLNLRNAVSQYEPQWMCWEPGREEDWVRQPTATAITDELHFPFFRRRMEFEEFVPAFGRWYAQDKLCACFVGIRSDESLNRYRTIAGKKSTFEGLQWTTWCGDTLYNAYPIYDWRTDDIWTFNGKFRAPYNRLYDRMHQAGLTIAQARICQPYGDDQRKGLWLFHTIEPETWGRIVKRVCGANQGALYAQESGNILGQRTIKKPDGITWREFAERLLDSMPPTAAEHYKNKIAVFLRWYQERGYPNGIPDSGSPTDRNTPSWTRICKTMLRNDYWCKGLSFSQHKTEAFSKYQRLMKERRKSWQLI
jgi:predicted phosphoadenosine phosphosulfate sulfurtransferase